MRKNTDIGAEVGTTAVETPVIGVQGLEIGTQKIFGYLEHLPIVRCPNKGCGIYGKQIGCHHEEMYVTCGIFKVFDVLPKMGLIKKVFSYFNKSK